MIRKITFTCPTNPNHQSIANKNSQSELRQERKNKNLTISQRTEIKKNVLKQYPKLFEQSTMRYEGSTTAKKKVKWKENFIFLSKPSGSNAEILTRQYRKMSIQCAYVQIKYNRIHIRCWIILRPFFPSLPFTPNALGPLLHGCNYCCWCCYCKFDST